MTYHRAPNLTSKPTVLTNIIADKQRWLIKAKQQQSLDSLKTTVTKSDRDFYQALKQKHTVFILECKKASPSKGLIRQEFDPTTIASIYKNYAAVISVLTDEKYFQGRFEYLPQVRQQVTQPVLCKDFIIDEYQIYLARYYQADAILLMLSILTDDQYRHLSHIAHQLNMGILTEASSEQEVQRAIQLKAKVLGINNRNLHDLTVDLERVKRWAPTIPKGITIISESGIYTHQQVLALSHYAHGFLIGSALMSQPNLTLAVHSIIFGENKICGLTRPEDAAAAYQRGAVYGGLIFVLTSPRYISEQQAQKMVTHTPLNWVGVFKDESIATVVARAQSLSLYAVQLHGQEDTQYIQLLRQQLPASCQIWRALSIESDIPEYDNPLVTRYIFDQGSGGSGRCFEWRLLHQKNLSQVLLAGGIRPENTIKAIQTGCIGLDVNSGVEIAPGIKDIEKIQHLFTALRAYPYSQ
jgi:indole-3-glycerol phosphate synthase / phosphoribosylanthranilate isomerase